MAIVWKLFQLFAGTGGRLVVKPVSPGFAIENQQYSARNRRIDWIARQLVGGCAWGILCGLWGCGWCGNLVPIPNSIVGTIWMETHCWLLPANEMMNHLHQQQPHPPSMATGETTAFTIIHVHLNKYRISGRDGNSRKNSQRRQILLLLGRGRGLRRSWGRVHGSNLVIWINNGIGIDWETWSCR